MASLRSMSSDSLAFIAPGSRYDGVRTSSVQDLGVFRDLGEFGLADRTTRGLVDCAIARHRMPNSLPERITLLVAPAPPPTGPRVRGPEIFTFIATPGVTRSLIRTAAPPEKWCYLAMSAALRTPEMTVDIQVVHRANEPPRPTPVPGRTEAILSHRGPERFVRLAVESLRRQTDPVDISLVLDQKYPCPRLLDDAADIASVRIWQVEPHPVGPYVGFQIVGWQSNAKFLLRQDTDDLALQDRVLHLKAASAAMDAGMVGSHDINVDQLEETVRPVRYPLDVRDALEKHQTIEHQIMPRNAICTRDAFELVGGYSTTRLFGHGVEFWLRAALKSRVFNVDEFLYVRRRHSNSLTTNRLVGIGTPARTGIQSARATALQAIRSGAQIEETMLAVEHRESPVQLLDLRSGEVRTYSIRSLSAPQSPGKSAGNGRK